MSTSVRKRAGAILLAGALSLTSTPVRADDIAFVPIGKAPTKGPSDALVTIVAFIDFQCPFCARTMRKLIALQARRPRDIRLVVKHFPLSFHRYSVLAAQAALEAQRQGKFWAFQAILWKLGTVLTPARLRSAAAAVGMDVKQYDTAITSLRHRPSVRTDRAEGRFAGVTGTPTIFINGRKFVGAQPYATYSAAAAKARAEALLLLKTPGTTRKNLYAAILKRAKKPFFVPERPRAKKLVELSPPRGRPTLGSKNAPLEIWLFANPMCYDMRLFVRDWERLQKETDGKLRLRFFHWLSSPKPIYRQAALVAEQAHRSGLFWPFLAAIAKQRPYRLERLLDVARALGIESPQTALTSKSIQKTVLADLNFAHRVLGTTPGRAVTCSRIWLPPGSVHRVWFAPLKKAAERRLDILDRSGFISPPP